MAIHFEVRQHPLHGRILFMTDGKTEVGGALDFGVRIVHLAAAGRENLLYEQPRDLSDSLATPEGWRIHGGHRFWAAPESSLSYYPDNDPVDCERLPSGFVLRQRTDPWTGMQKELAAVFADDGSLCVTHTLIYEGEESVQAAAWGVTTLKGGGEAFYPFPKAEGSEFSVNRTLALWEILHCPMSGWSLKRTVSARDIPVLTVILNSGSTARREISGCGIWDRS